MKKFLFGILGLLFAVPAVAATLPAGYTELEYIESTGTQYIDTGVKIASTDTVETEFKNSTSTDYGALYGIYTTGESSAFYANGTYYGYDASNSKVNTNVAVDNQWHTVVHDFVNGTLQLDDTIVTFTPFEFANTTNNGLFTRFYDGSYGYFFKGFIKSHRITRNGVVILDMVSAKRNSDNALGMYDTVGNRFYTNAGTGEFIGGPVVNSCRNLFDGSIEYGSIDNTGVSIGASTDRVRPTHTITIPAGTYTVSCANGYQIYGVVNGVSWSGSGWATGSKTFTVSDPTNTFIFALRNASNPTAELDLNTAFNIQLEQGSTATEYVPFCANQIKIATTAYNSARFSPVVTELNDTIATIRSVVTNTINQTKAIADLQATKQTRPDETCPAGKKCLLVEDDAGMPHWYEIIESPEVQ